MARRALKHLGIRNLDHALTASALTLCRAWTGIQAEGLADQLLRIQNTQFRELTERPWIQLNGLVHKHVHTVGEHAGGKRSTADLLPADLRQIHRQNGDLLKDIIRWPIEGLVITDIISIVAAARWGSRA